MWRNWEISIHYYSYLIVNTWASASIVSHQSVHETVNSTRRHSLHSLPHSVDSNRSPVAPSYHIGKCSSARVTWSWCGGDPRWASATTWRGGGGGLRTWYSSDFSSEFRQTVQSTLHSSESTVQPGRVVDWLILELYENPGIRVYRVNSFV